MARAVALCVTRASGSNLPPPKWTGIKYVKSSFSRNIDTSYLLRITLMNLYFLQLCYQDLGFSKNLPARQSRR